MTAAQPALNLNNTYWLLRHGCSVANEQDVVVSRPENGEQPRWGLTAQGRQQAAAAGQLLLQQMGSEVEAESLLLLTSPFSRTVETALGAGAALGIQQGDPRLQVRPWWVGARCRSFSWRLASSSFFASTDSQRTALLPNAPAAGAGTEGALLWGPRADQLRQL